MPLLSVKRSLLWSLAVLVFFSCEKEQSCESCSEYNNSGVNRPPVANAGFNQTITLANRQIVLNGSQSTDPNNNITSYAWNKISGPSNVTMANANSVLATVTDYLEGIYGFELTVTDAFGLFSKDTVLITVSNPNNLTEESGQWTKLYSLPENDFFFGSNHINFLMGIQDRVFGISKNGSLWVYNPQTNFWLKKATLPSNMASSNFSVVFSINNIGYVIGNGTCRQYNATTDRWTTKNNAPVGADHVDYSVPLVIGNKCYLIGYTNNLVTLYDPSDDTYKQKGKFSDISAVAGFVINHEGYCIQKDGRCWKYDPLLNVWHKKANLPENIYNMSAFSLNGYGYVIGDLNRAAYSQNGRMKVWRYNPSLDQWKQIREDYPGEGVYEVRTASLGGIVYAGLGYTRTDKDAIDFWSFR